MVSRKPTNNQEAQTSARQADEDLLRLMIENAPFYHNIKDPAGRFIYINKVFENWIGLPKSDVLGKTLEEIGTETRNIGKIGSIDKLVLETGQTVETEVFFQHRNGQSQERFLIKYPIRSETEEILAVGTFALDISKRKQEQAQLVEREELFRHAFDYAPIGMALVDLDGNRLRVNQALADNLGYTIEEMLYTHMSTTSADAEMLAKSLELRQQVIEGKIKSYTNHRVFRHKNGHLIFGEVTGSLLRDERGNPQYFVTHMVDMTESYRSRTELIESKEKAERASHAKSEFQATMSHELRTPLTSLIGALGLIKGTAVESLPEHALTLLDIAERNSGRLITLINDLLDYEKFTEGRLQFDLQPCDINLLVLKSVEINQGYATEYATHFVYQQIPDLLFVNLEERRFEQIMSNLLSNAAKFSHGSARVDVTVTEQNNRVTIAVADRGIGIPEPALERIFDRFSQIDSTDSRTHGGTGLGLAITKALVEGMGGTIKVKSKVDVGSTFSISFPKADRPILETPFNEAL